MYKQFSKVWVVRNQIQTIDKKSITENLGIIKEKEILQIKIVLKGTFIDLNE